MTTVLSMFIPTIPKAQPRPRAFVRKMGGKAVARVYDAGTAEAFKGDIAAAVRRRLPAAPIEGAVCVRCAYYLPRPKRLCRKSDLAGPVRMIGKPDLDNLNKAVYDALTHIGLWRDDGQVAREFAEKYYHAKSGRPGLMLVVESLEEQQA